MKLGPTEQARLLVFQVAELARRQRDRGLRLNAPEAIAIACDEMHMAARAGSSYREVVAAGRASVRPEHLIDGVAALIGEIRVEVLLREGSRLIVLRGLGASKGETAVEPGAIEVADGALTLNEGLSSFELEVVNESYHQVRGLVPLSVRPREPPASVRPRGGSRITPGHTCGRHSSLGPR